MKGCRPAQRLPSGCASPSVRLWSLRSCLSGFIAGDERVRPRRRTLRLLGVSRRGMIRSRVDGSWMGLCRLRCILVSLMRVIGRLGRLSYLRMQCGQSCRLMLVWIHQSLGYLGKAMVWRGGGFGKKDEKGGEEKKMNESCKGVGSLNSGK